LINYLFVPKCFGQRPALTLRGGNGNF